MNICVRFVEMILQSSLTLCPRPAAASFRTEQWAPMILFDMTLHICQARKIGVTAVDFARNTKYGVELVGHGVVEGRRKARISFRVRWTSVSSSRLPDCGLFSSAAP